VGLRIDKALAQHNEIGSRSQAALLISRGSVLLNGHSIKSSHKTLIGDIYTVKIDILSPSEILPYEFELDIVYEDDDLLVINKPSGLVVHPAAGHRNDTLVNALVFHSKTLAAGSADIRPGVVHRIDKETSGLIVVAKTDVAMRSLSAQFKKKSVHRVYWAVCYGIFKQPTGTIKSHLRRHPNDRKKFSSDKKHASASPTGKLAITHYRAIKSIPSGLSLVHCQLETGRTHQIRVHLSELGHPIVADSIYCTSHRARSSNSIKLKKSLATCPHLMLHAAELGFTHPTTNKVMKFSVGWPKESQPFLKSIEFL
jgi:23S rRNA pseudouridine1911/1915/1917 synthase